MSERHLVGASYEVGVSDVFDPNIDDVDTVELHGAAEATRPIRQRAKDLPASACRQARPVRWAALAFTAFWMWALTVTEEIHSEGVPLLR